MEDYNELTKLFHEERSKVSQELLDTIKRKTEKLKQLEDEINIDIDVLDYYNDKFEEDYNKHKDVLLHVIQNYPTFFNQFNISDLLYELENLDEEEVTTLSTETIANVVLKVINKHESKVTTFTRKVESNDIHDINTAKLSIIHEGDVYKEKNGFDYSSVTFDVVKDMNDYYIVQGNYSFSYKNNNDELPF